MEKLTKEERKALKKQEWKEELQKEQRKNILNKIALWGGILAVIIISFWAIINFTGTSQNTSKQYGKLPAITTADIATGPANAMVTLVEYADFQCPACGFEHPFIKQLLNDYNGKIRFVYRFFPLTNIHRHALEASQAAYAAGKQGKFWEMHDMLFEHQTDWAQANNTQDIFFSYAKKLNLDSYQYQKDFADGKTKDFIMNEENQGETIGVNSTPTFFINGKHLENNPQSYSEFKVVIDARLQR